MTRSSAYVVLGERFAREVETDPALREQALARAVELKDDHKADALRALGVS